MPTYYPPPLSELVRIRNPADKPQLTADRYGKVLDTQANTDAIKAWGFDAWCDKRDKRPYTRNEEGKMVYVLESVFTIRATQGIDPNCEIVFRESVYQSSGPPIRRGGAGQGRASEYLEIHARLRE